MLPGMSTGFIGRRATSPSPLTLLAAVLALIGAVLACYLPTAGDYWIYYDNPQLIQQEPRTRALTLEGGARLAALRTLVTTPHHNLYQPLASFSWAIDHALFGWDRSGFHAHSLALHIAAVLGFFFLALRASGSLLPAFLGALLCGVHPVMVQSVCWPISRTSSLAAVWILIGSHLYLSYARRSHRTLLLVLSTLAFAMSLTAKVLPSVALIPLLIDIWLDRPLRMRVWLEKLPLVLVAALMTLVNLQISAGFEAPIVRPWLEVLAKAPESFALAVANTLWPRNLALYYPYPNGASLIGWRWLLIAGGSAGALVAGVAQWRRGERGVLLSVTGFILLLAPPAAAIRYRDILTADRYLYVPVFCLGLGVACLVARIPRGSSPAAILLGRSVSAIAALAALVLGIQTRADSRMWADEEALWQRVVTQTPAPLPYLALCKLYAREGRRSDAVEACERAYALAGLDPHASKDAAYSFYLIAHARRTGEEWQAADRPGAADYIARASAVAREAIARWPTRIDLRYELGRSQLSAGDAQGAVETFDSILALEPGDEASITYLGVALFEAGEFDRAREVLERQPSSGFVEPIHYITLARIYRASGRYDRAAAASLAWVNAAPQDEGAHTAFQQDLDAARAEQQLESIEDLRRYYERAYAPRSAR
jgi:tetratricopeptide (TPR) repeat protein